MGSSWRFAAISRWDRRWSPAPALRCRRAHWFKLQLRVSLNRRRIPVQRGSAMKCWPQAAMLLIIVSALAEGQTHLMRNAFVRPYKVKPVPPVDFHNSERIFDLMRAGQLYLSLADAIALALENNLDIELERYL